MRTGLAPSRDVRRRAAPTAVALAALAFSASAAASDRDVGFAAFLLDVGLPAEAAQELERLAAADVADERLADVAARAGNELARADDLGAAASVLSLSAAHTRDPARADDRRLAAGAVLLRARRYARGIDTISRVEAFGATEEVRARAGRLLCVGHLVARTAAPARECVLSLVPEGDPRRARTEALLDRLSIDPALRARVGGTLSALVPGLGQTTAGDPGDGALALVVNGAWMLGTVVLAADGLWVDATLVSVGAGLRYYVGNVQNGARAWRAAAERSRAEASRELARLVAATPRGEREADAAGR